jgi:hypothetical protein
MQKCNQCGKRFRAIGNHCNKSSAQTLLDQLGDPVPGFEYKWGE